MDVRNASRRTPWVFGAALALLLLIGSGCDAVGDMFGAWTGVYDSDYLPDSDTANFQTLERCLAWGRDQVDQHGGSYQCGKNCKSSTEFNSLDCEEVH